ncbi:MAG: repressor LexA [Candidatus Moraniibacteriota bacterium]|nr:MAG: repressor LexA [Candidatus Moranbacteria bacterium]
MIQHLSETDKKVYVLVRNKIVHGLPAPTLREINEVTGKTSPRSAVLALQRLEKAGLIRRSGRKIRLVSQGNSSNASVTTIDVPLVGSIAAGAPILAEENVEVSIPVSIGLARPGSAYFLLRVRGTSMNQATVRGTEITDGSIVLVRQQPVADNGDVVVALINDETTVKMLDRKNGMVILRPKSSDPDHRPIILTSNCIIQGVVVGVLPADLY